jgi:ATP-dependent DNA ligase
VKYGPRSPDQQGRLRFVAVLSAIVEAALKLRQQHFVIDGEAVVLGPGGVSDFVALNSGKRNEHEFSSVSVPG